MRTGRSTPSSDPFLVSTVVRPARIKRPFVFSAAFRRIRGAVRHLPKAALFELADDGFDSPFEQVVACIISVRTRDEVTIEVARELFAKARTPDDVAAMPVRAIDAAIRRSTF